jgi:hypothetical protein
MSNKISDDLRTLRKKWISIALKHARPGTGSGDIFLFNRTAMTKHKDLRSILKGIPWAVVSGVAKRAYMPERATQDLDIVINLAQNEEVYKRLNKAGFKYLQELSIGGSVWQLPDKSIIDVIESNSLWISEALLNLNYDPQGLPVLSLPYLILMKMQSGRTQDLADVSRMLGLASDDDVQKVRDVIIKYIPAQIDDFESLLYLGKLELGMK